MPATDSNQLEQLLKWLEQNAFWDAEALEVRRSEVGGLGVFMKPGAFAQSEHHKLLLRVPKASVLSPKNSFVYSLIMDYVPEDDTIDLKSGMYSVVLAYIYEQSAGDQSPWHSYLSSFSLDAESVPVCLWSPAEKQALFNTECDLRNMLHAGELVSFFMECVRFADYTSSTVARPEILDYSPPTGTRIDADVIGEPLVRFGQAVQAVVSRAFMVDKHLGLCLVPGADLFNHLSPAVTEFGIESRENVHFVCDDDEELCEECGEVGCSHQDSEMESTEDEEEEGSDQSGSESHTDQPPKESEPEQEFSHLLEGPEVQIDSSESDSESDSEGEADGETDGEGDTEGEAQNEDEGSDAPEMKEITMEDIEDVEKDFDSEMSDADTEEDDEEASTLSISDNDGSQNLQESNDRMELAKHLSDGSKCCDVVLTSPTCGELFNTYGEDLANAYLLQRYGFISHNNPNDTCLLSVQMLSYLKQEKKSKRRQLEEKLEWYNDFFGLVDELAGQEFHLDDCKEACCDEEHEDGEHEDEEHEDGEHEHEEEEHEHEEENNPEDPETFFQKIAARETSESWELSPKVLYNGHPTLQTLALVRILQMPFKVFLAKFCRCPSDRRLQRRIQRYLLSRTISPQEKPVLLQWVKSRFQRYTAHKPRSPRAPLILDLVAQEKQILQRAIGFLERL